MNFYQDEFVQLIKIRELLNKNKYLYLLVTHNDVVEKYEFTIKGLWLLFLIDKKVFKEKIGKSGYYTQSFIDNGYLKLVEK